MSREKNLSSKAEMIRQLAVGMLRNVPNHTLSLHELHKGMESLLDMKLRSDHLKMTLQKDPRLVLTEINNHVHVVLASNESDITVEEFVLKALDTLTTEEYPNSFHAVFSGFNKGFRAQFPGLDPVKEVKKLAEAGKIKVFPCKGGALIVRASSEKKKKKGPIEIPDADAVLKKMGLK